MGLSRPELNQDRALENKLAGVWRPCESVEQTFESVSRQDELKVFAALAGEIHQSLAHRRRQVA